MRAKIGSAYVYKAARFARRESEHFRRAPWAEEIAQGGSFIATCAIVLFIVFLTCLTFF
jgi:hypothetical protein